MCLIYPSDINSQVRYDLQKNLFKPLYNFNVNN